MFSNSRKVAQQTTQRLISGHCALVAWWTLKQAGVLQAIIDMQQEAGEGLDAKVYAVRKNMAPDLLIALVGYLATPGAGLLSMAGDKASLSPEGRALLDHDDGVLDFVHACQPALSVAEHLLAKLKTPPGVTGVRRTESLLASRSRRQAKELLPAVEGIVRARRCSHLLDTACGGGELLLAMASARKSVVGVGITPDDESAAAANARFVAAGFEKRLIAIPGAANDVLTDTPRAFERIGISRQLWADLDLILLPQLFSDSPRDAGSVTVTLAYARNHFPRAALLVIEPVTGGAHLDKNYYAPEFEFLLQMTRSPLWTAEQWRDIFVQAKVPLSEEVALTVDGLTLFLAARPSSAAPAKPAAAKR